MQKNIDFLKNLHLKTAKFGQTYLTTNISRTTFPVVTVSFTNYVISYEDFESIFKIIQDELLLIIPKENLMGFVEGYAVYDLDGELILMFGKENLPKDEELRKIFSYCQTEQNKLILRELQKEKILDNLSIKDNYEDYDY